MPNQSENLDNQSNQVNSGLTGTGPEKPHWYGDVSLSNTALQTPMMQQFIVLSVRYQMLCCYFGWVTSTIVFE